VPPSHEWAADGAVDTSALKRARIILREHGSGTRQVVEDALRRARLDVKKLPIVLDLDSTESIKSAIQAGLGIGFVSRWALGKELALGLLRTVSVKGLRIRRQFQFVYLQGPPPSGVEGEFLRYAAMKRADFHTPKTP
jgi:DNA-binding transcriptional LysR family regulator